MEHQQGEGLAMVLTLVCRDDNDLYQALGAAGAPRQRVASLQAGLEAAPEGGAVLALADDYPRPALAVTEADLDVARTRGLRLLLEYPAAVPGVPLGPPQATQWERAVTA
jgi:hypothetical protein